MEASILKSTKKLLGLADSYTHFDLDVITNINTGFSFLTQLGIGPDGFVIEDESANWDELDLPDVLLSSVKTYIWLKAQLYFDPPTLSFLIEAKNNQIQELEHRLTFWRDWLLDPVDPMAGV